MRRMCNKWVKKSVYSPCNDMLDQPFHGKINAFLSPVHVEMFKAIGVKLTKRCCLDFFSISNSFDKKWNTNATKVSILKLDRK